MIAVMIAGTCAMIVSLVGTRYLITFFRNRGKGQPILGKEDRGPEHHMHKQGTPTMGGLAIVVAAFIGWVVAHFRHGLVFSNQAAIMWVGILVLSGIGFLDDYIKVNKAHNRGIFWKKKSYITLAISMGIAWWLVAATGISETISFTRYNFPGWQVPWYVWVVFAGVTIWSTSNAVNVTDGLDGLAAGAGLLAFLAFTIIAYWAFRNPEIYGVGAGGVVNPLDLAAVAAAFAGACGGFLWFNAAPARIIMGDVGALAIGTALALLALTTNTQILLVLICGINVMEAGSVAVQMAVFKASGRKRRLFRMSPIHHHFELLGWPETTVIIRFWLIAGVCVATSMAIYIGDFTRLEFGAMTTTALVYGVAIAGEAVALTLHDRGVRVLVADDTPTDAKIAAAAAVGAELVASPDETMLDSLVAMSDMVCPAPGVAETHPVIVAASRRGTPIRTEIDLAYEWEQQRSGGPRPMLAVTGTDGKTTTTMMAAAMLRSAGLKVAAAGNTELPLISALDSDVDAFVVECSSFRLNWIEHFRSEASVWLNLAPDHQNWHMSMQAYEQAKARMWKNNRATDIAVGFAADQAVMRNLAKAPGRRLTFGADGADYRLVGSSLTGPVGAIADRSIMTRDLPHDVSNALAAAAISIESGLADKHTVAEALATFEHPPHRIEPLGEYGGARWFNDSKATTPHAVITAIRGFRDVVLLAGGRNKGLDLASIASEHDRVKSVVALGEAAPIIRAAFVQWCPVVEVSSMRAAVSTAAALAGSGDTVLLSPGCASFDWYPDGGYPARGDDFKQLVHDYFQADAS